MKTIVISTLSVIGVLMGVICISLILCIPTWLLWNWLMPVIFGLKTITIFQAWGLMVLSGILFKSTLKKGD